MFEEDIGLRRRRMMMLVLVLSSWLSLSIMLSHHEQDFRPVVFVRDTQPVVRSVSVQSNATNATTQHALHVKFFGARFERRKEKEA